MEPKISIVQFLFKQDWKILSESLAANPTMGSHKFSTSGELLQFCSQEQSCLVIVNISTREDLIQLATFFKVSKKSLKNTVLKVVVLNATENKQYEKAIAKLGNVEILEPNVNVKALRFKMEFWMKAMKGQAKKLGAMNQRTVEAAAADAAPENKTFVQWPSMECESDIWLLVKEADCKRIIGRWMVKLMGPSPYVGQWNDVPNKKNVYAFEIKKSYRDLFISGDGSWFFKGDQKPEFNWQENRWMFTGDDFELFFYDTKVSSRLRLSNKVLSLASNSLFAKTKETLIVDSFNKDLVFKNEAELLKDNSLEFENEGDLGGKLEGKVDEKETEKGNLKGRLKGEEKKELSEREKLQQRQKEKAESERKLRTEEKAEAEAKRLQKIKDEEVRAEAQKTENQIAKAAAIEAKKHAQGKEEISASWQGKLSQDKKEEEKAKREGQAPAASEKKDKEDHSQHNEKLSASWGGKLTPQEQYEREQKEKSGFSEKHSSPDLKGKTDPSEKLKSHWGGKGGVDQMDGDGLLGPGAEGLKEGSLLDLKKSENEHQTHYKNHNEAAKYEATEAKKNQYQQESGPGEMGGKGNTDKLASHYGTGQKRDVNSAESGNLKGEPVNEASASHKGRKNHSDSSEHHEKEEKSAKAPLSGKGQAEKLSGHYKSTRKKSGTNSSGEDESQESVSPELESFVLDIETSADLPKGSPLFDDSNVLSFEEKASAKAKKEILPEDPAAEMELEKLTETSSITSYIIQNNRKYDCKLDDYFENNVIFLLKGEGLKNSETATLDITLDYRSEEARIYCEGRVMSIDEDGEGGFFVTIEVSSLEAQKFENFMNLLKARQESIHTFFGKVKGF